MTMAAQSGKTTGTKTETSKTGTSAVKTPATANAPTGQQMSPSSPAQQTPQTPQTPQTAATASRPQRPAPSSRSGIQLNVARVVTAYRTGAKSRSIKAIQYALEARGFAPGNKEGLVDRATHDAYVAYQKSIGEAPTGVPTASSLDYLGFTIVG